MIAADEKDKMVGAMKVAAPSNKKPRRFLVVEPVVGGAREKCGSLR